MVIDLFFKGTYDFDLKTIEIDNSCSFVTVIGTKVFKKAFVYFLLTQHPLYLRNLCFGLLRFTFCGNSDKSDIYVNFTVNKLEIEN